LLLSYFEKNLPPWLHSKTAYSLGWMILPFLD